MRRAWGPVAAMALILALFGLRWLFPERPVDYVGFRALLDAGFALGLLGLVLLTASGLGWKVLCWLGLEGLTSLERIVFAVPIGMGILAYGVMALGFCGLLYPSLILLWLVGTGIWASLEWSDAIHRLRDRLAQSLQGMRELALGEKVLVVVGGLMLIPMTFMALSPPYDYDGLMYHLQAPRLFLEAGRIVLLPELGQANGPFTIEMLFTLGMAFGSDTFARLVHLSCAVWLVLATLVVGRRFLKGGAGWVAALLLLGIQMLPFLSTLAYIDIALGLYEFLGMCALLLWREENQRRLLILGGLMIGGALGCKYLALGTLGVLGLWALWQSRKEGLKRVLTNGVLFGLPALLLALPWYVKNLLLAGNPLYPLVFGGPGWDAERLGMIMTYLRSFGTGRRFVDYLLLPWNLYTKNASFGAFGTSSKLPNVFFPLMLLYPFTERRKSITGLFVMAGLLFIVWATGSQQTRFLLPIFPAVSVLSGYVITYFASRLKVERVREVLLAVILIPVAIATLLFSLGLAYVYSPIPVVLGQESKQAFLQRTVGNYRALEFVQENLAPDVRVMMMWDGKGYYCDERCLPDADQAQWTRLVLDTSDPQIVAGRLNEMGVTHLFYNTRDARFLMGRDPAGHHRRAREFLEQEFVPACAQEIYRDETVILWEISCH